MPVCVQAGLRVVYFFLGGAEMFWQCDWPQHTQLSGRNVRLWETNCTVTVRLRLLESANNVYARGKCVSLRGGFSSACASLTLRICWDRTKWGLSINVLLSLAALHASVDQGFWKNAKTEDSCLYSKVHSLIFFLFWCYREHCCLYNRYTQVANNTKCRKGERCKHPKAGQEQDVSESQRLAGTAAAWLHRRKWWEQGARTASWTEQGRVERTRHAGCQAVCTSNRSGVLQHSSGRTRVGTKEHKSDMAEEMKRSRLCVHMCLSATVMST